VDARTPGGPEIANGGSEADEGQAYSFTTLAIDAAGDDEEKIFDQQGQSDQQGADSFDPPFVSGHSAGACFSSLSNSRIQLLAQSDST
jgi:hypothetical protein